MKTASDTRAALVLCLLAVVNYLLFYGLGIFLARTLGVEGFAKYSVAVAAVTMLASFATLGLEKLALRVIPTYVAQDNWGFASGFARFAVYTIVLVSWAAALVYFLFVRDTLDGVNPWFVLVLMTMLVPCMAVFLFLIEILSASGDAVAATLVRLPCYYGLDARSQDRIIEAVFDFFETQPC